MELPDYPQYNENRKKITLSDLSLSRRIKFTVGKFLVKALPDRASKVEKNPFSRKNTKLDALIRNGLYADALESRDFQKVRGPKVLPPSSLLKPSRSITTSRVKRIPFFSGCEWSIR